MKQKRYFVNRAASDVREAAARLVERMAIDKGPGTNALLKAAERIRKIPVAGFLGKKRE